MFCLDHQQREADFQCVSCKKLFCDDCVEIREYTGSTAYICRLCGGKCEKTKSHQEKTVVKQDEAVKTSGGNFNFFASVPSTE